MPILTDTLCIEYTGEEDYEHDVDLARNMANLENELRNFYALSNLVWDDVQYNVEYRLGSHDE